MRNMLKLNRVFYFLTSFGIPKLITQFIISLTGCNSVSHLSFYIALIKYKITKLQTVKE